MRAQHAFLPLALLAAACASTQPAADHGAGAPAQTTTTTVSAKPAQAEGPTAHVELIAFSDFHGWLLPLEPKGFSKYYGGIAHIAAMISGKEKLDGSSAIIVDNGDMWTGPTESTILRGEPVIQAYNRLGLSAANIANHEFDFGTEVLKARIGEAKFPFLGANIVKAGTTESASFVKPFTIVTRGRIKVRIIGLSFADTPRTTLAKHVAGLEFRPYKETLQRVVPEARKAGPR
jgi:2',3'-cyclic-nucleotide 2'-phosphodiesterase (5'-nucleotidase family)